MINFKELGYVENILILKTERANILKILNQVTRDLYDL